MHLISLGRNRQLETLSCSMEPQIVGHFLELGYGGQLFSGVVREERGLCPRVEIGCYLGSCSHIAHLPPKDKGSEGGGQMWSL